MPAAERSVITESSSDPKGETETHTTFVRRAHCRPRTHPRLGEVRLESPNLELRFASENLRLTALLREGRKAPGTQSRLANTRGGSRKCCLRPLTFYG